MQPIILGAGLDLVNPPQSADPGSLSDCQNFEIANIRGLRKIQGIRSYSGGVSNDVGDPYIFHSYGAGYGVNASGWSDPAGMLEGAEVTWGSGGTFRLSDGTLTTYDGKGYVCFSRLVDFSDGVIAICNVQGRLPNSGDTLTDNLGGCTSGVIGPPLLLSDYVKNGDITIFGSYTDTVDSAADLIEDMDMDSVSAIHAYPVPCSPLGGARGGFYFKDQLYVIADIETWSFTAGSALPADGNGFLIYYAGTFPNATYVGYQVDSVTTTSGDWNAGTAAGTIQLVMTGVQSAKSSVKVPTACRNNSTGVTNPLTLGTLVRSKVAGMWREGPAELGRSGSDWDRMDLGYEVRFKTGTNYPTVLNRANRDAQLEATVSTAAFTTCGTATAASGWVNPSNAQGAADSVVATQPNDSFVREKLTCTNFGFNLPSTAVILGVEMRFRRRVSGGNAKDTHIYLTGVQGSQDKKSNTLWHTGAIGDAGALSGIYGSPSDTWGTSLTPSIVNSTGFGVTIEVFNNGSTGGNREIDSVEIQVTYKDRSSIVYFRDTVAGTDVSTGRIIWYHKEKGGWTPTNTAEGTMTVYSLSAASAIREGHTIRTASGGGGTLIATCASAAEKVYHPASGQLEANGSQWEFTNTENFFGAVGTEQIFGASGASFAGSWDGNYWIRIRTGVDGNQDMPRHVAKHGDQLALGYSAGVVIFSDLGYPESYAGVVGGTLGGSSPISDDTTTYVFGGGAQQLLMGDAVYGLKPLSQQSLGVGCKASIQQAVGSGGSIVANVIAADSGILEYTMQNIGVVVFLDYRGIGAITATNAFGDFARGRLSDLVAPWLIPRLQQTGGSLVSTSGPVKTEIVRNKNQLRTYFKDRYCLTMTMVGNDFSSPQFTIQKLPFVPAMTCTGVSSGGKDFLFLAPYGMAELGAFTNDLKAEYEADSSITINANLYAPAFVYQGDVGSSWDRELAIDSYVTVNGGAMGREWLEKHFDRMVVSGQCFGFGPFGVNFGVNFGDIEDVTPTNVNGGSLSYVASKAFTEQTFSNMVDIKRDGYALTMKFVSTGSNVYGATTAQTSPYTFRPVTLQAIIPFDESMKTRRGGY